MLKTGIRKSDDELQIVWGELYVPEVIDSQTDMMSVETVMKAAYNWMVKSETRCIDIEHDNQIIDAAVVESFIARKGDPDFIEGAWVVAVHVADPDIWEKIKKQEINGFSLQGNASIGMREVVIPTEVVGLTKDENGHTHKFTVAHSDKGEFIGGITDVVDGHYHVIRKGTVTEEADGHIHRFDLVRGVLSAAG